MKYDVHSKSSLGEKDFVCHTLADTFLPLPPTPLVESFFVAVIRWCERQENDMVPLDQV